MFTQSVPLNPRNSLRTGVVKETSVNVAKAIPFPAPPISGIQLSCVPSYVNTSSGPQAVAVKFVICVLAQSIVAVSCSAIAVQLCPSKANIFVSVASVVPETSAKFSRVRASPGPPISGIHAKLSPS